MSTADVYNPLTNTWGPAPVTRQRIPGKVNTRIQRQRFRTGRAVFGSYLNLKRQEAFSRIIEKYHSGVVPGETEAVKIADSIEETPVQTAGYFGRFINWLTGRK